MSDETAQVIVAMAVRTIWFIGQATAFFILWKLVGVFEPESSFAGYIDGVITYALIRIMLDPPKLHISFGQ